MKIVFTLAAVLIITLAIGSFAYGLLTLVMAEINYARSSLTRVDPTYAVAWLLVSLILGKVAGVLMDAGDGK